MQRKLTRRQREKKERERRRRIRNSIIGATAAVSLLAAAFGVYQAVDNQTTPAVQQYVTLQDAKTDSELVQTYLDRLLGTGRVPLTTEVVYDPYMQENIEFWKDQLSRFPEKGDLIQSYIGDLNLKRAVLEEFRQLARSGREYSMGIALMNTSIGFDFSKKIFVYDLSFFAASDDDILWSLEHERCHAEIPGEYQIVIPGEIDLEQAKMAMDYVSTIPEVEESRCYTNQFRSEQEGKFIVSAQAYNSVLVNFRLTYNNLLMRAESPGIEGIIIRELIRNEFINPYQLQLR